MAMHTPTILTYILAIVGRTTTTPDLPPSYESATADPYKHPLEYKSLFPLLHSIEEGVLDLSGKNLDSLPEDLFTEGEAENITALILADNNMTELPDMSRLVNLQHLDVSGNLIRTLHSSLSELKNMKILNISDNRITDMGIMRMVSTLESLNASNNPITTLYVGDIQNLKGLKILNLSGINISTNMLGYITREFKELEELHLNDAQIPSLPTTITNLTKLKVLCMNGNKITKVPDMSGLDALQILDLGNNRISKLQKLPTGLVELILDGNNVATISDAIPHPLESLKKFSIRNNKLRKIPGMLSPMMQNLEVLDVSRNQISKYAQNIINLGNLQELYAGNNKMEEIPEEVCKLPLTVLDFSNNQLTRIPERTLLGFKGVGIADLRKSLQKLILSGNQISEIPGEVRDLKMLRVLDVSRNNLGKIPDIVVYGLKVLDELYFDGNGLTEVPENISNLWRLRVLSLGDNNIKLLPGSVCGLKYLEELNASENNLTALPDYICLDLKKLVSLDASYNELTSLPHSMIVICGPGSLERLNFEYNFDPKSGAKLRVGGETIKELPKLTHLILTGCETSIVYPSELGVCKKLQVLCLGDNTIKSIPSFICTFTDLVELVFSDNHIEKISKNIINLKKLKILDLGRNRLDKIPNLDDLRRLEVLKVNSNHLKSLPFSEEGMENMTCLRVLDARNNEIENVPPNVTGLRRLEEFILKDNNLTLLPREILSLVGNIRVLDLSGTNEICEHGTGDKAGYKELKDNFKDNVTFGAIHGLSREKALAQGG